MKYLINGLAIENYEQSENVAVVKFGENYTFDRSDIFYEIDGACVDLYDKFTMFVFPDIDAYHREMPITPLWVYHAGLDSDFTVDKTVFEGWSQESKLPNLNKHLFLADCLSLIGNIQHRIIASKSLFCQFYKNLSNVDAHLFEEDGLYWTSGENITVVFSTLHDLVITNYALLDLLTKLAYQFENMPTDYGAWPKLKCQNILYGNKCKITKINKFQTVFEDHPSIKTIENLRHELIHNGTWESQPKVHYQINQGVIIEKFIFQPDLNDAGTLQKIKNRKRFFANSQKINENLPGICTGFWERVLATVLAIKNFNYLET